MFYGAIPSPPDERDYKASDYVAQGVRPATFIQDKAPVLHQGNVGSCVAHALSTMKYLHERKERGCHYEWSTDFIYHNRLSSDHQGAGMVVREALSQLQKCGTCLHQDLPTNTDYPNQTAKTIIDALREKAKPQNVKNYVRCFNTSEICDGIFQNGAAILVIDVRSSFDSHYMKTKDTMLLPIPKTSEASRGFHCVCAVGYTEEGIIIQNSWGELWGFEGQAIIPYDYPIVESWSVIDEMKDYTIIELPIGNNKAKVNGQEVILDVPAQIINGRTLVPIRFVSEVLDCEVEYVKKENLVVIRKIKE